MNKKSSIYRDVLGATEFMAACFDDFVYPKHVHETFAIGLIETGAQTFVTKAGTEVMPENKLCVINPDVVHAGWKGHERGWRYRMFYPSPAVVARSLDLGLQDIDRLGFGRFVIEDDTLFHAFHHLHVEAMSGTDLLDLEQMSIRFIRQLFRRHAGARDNRPPPKHEIVGRCREFLDAHLERSVSISELARISGISETHVIRTFSATTGMSPHAFQIARRIEKAKALLAKGVDPAETAASCGFFDQSHMHKHFRRIVGVTPGKFAQSCRM